MLFRFDRIAAGVLSILLLAVPVLAETIEVTVAGGLANALAQAEAGDILELECGVYQEQGLVMVPGVTIRGFGCAILESDASDSILLLQQGGAETRLEGLIFRLMDNAFGMVHKGGALRFEDSSIRVDDCEFTGLQANYGGAVHCSAGSRPVFTNCRFLNNWGRAVGGAIACVDNSSPTLDGCLLAGNSAGASGGAIQAVAGSQPALFNCTLANNQSPEGAAASGWEASRALHDKSIWVGQDGASAWLGDYGSVPVISCSDLWDNGGGDWVGALESQAVLDENFSADPVFCGPGLYTLNAASPCADGVSACGRIGAFDVDCDWEVPVPDDLPVVTDFKRVFPNPFNPITTVLFDVAKDSQVQVEVYDVAGRRVRRLVDEPLARGTHQVTWRGNDDSDRGVAAGVYFLRLAADETVAVRRVTLIK